jgi:transposase InsO family protein
MIDPATRWFEIKAIEHPTSHEAMEAFNNTWLSRYPRPTYVGYDNGSEFKDVFRQLCKNYGITPKISSDYNPQANSIVERVHLTLGNMLRSFQLEKQELNASDPWTPFLTAAAFAIRSTYHTVLDATPGEIIFGRDMILPIQFKADWAAIIERKRSQVAKDNTRENKTRVPHVYNTGDLVLLTRPGILPKLSTPREGPYKILRVFTNGTVRIQRGIVSQRVNIRRITPYNDRPN